MTLAASSTAFLFVARGILSLPLFTPLRAPEPRQEPERPAGGHQPGLGVGNLLVGLGLSARGIEVRPKLVGDGFRRLQVAMHLIRALAQRVRPRPLGGQRGLSVGKLGQGSVGEGKRGIGASVGLVAPAFGHDRPLFGLFGSFFGAVLRRVGDVRIVFAGTPVLAGELVLGHHDNSRSAPAVGNDPMPVATSRQHPRGVRTDPETSAERRIGQA